MAKGDEPLRSFGDLLQFFKKATPEPVIKPKKIEPTEPVASESVVADTPADSLIIMPLMSCKMP